jgi:predicted transcriptional regulator
MSAMQLKEWQKENGVSNVELANLISVHRHCDPSMLCHYHAGRRNFSAPYARLIFHITKGDVSELEVLYRKEGSILT